MATSQYSRRSYTEHPDWWWSLSVWVIKATAVVKKATAVSPFGEALATPKPTPSRTGEVL